MEYIRGRERVCGGLAVGAQFQNGIFLLPVQVALLLSI